MLKFLTFNYLFIWVLSGELLTNYTKCELFLNLLSGVLWILFLIILNWLEFERGFN